MNEDERCDEGDSPDCYAFHRCPRSTHCPMWRDGIGCTGPYAETE